MQLNANVPGDLAYIIQALVLFSIASEFLPAIQRALPKGLMSRRPPLVPAVTGTTVTDLPANDALVENGAEPAEMQKADAVEGGAAQSLPAGESSSGSSSNSSRIEED